MPVIYQANKTNKISVVLPEGKTEVAEVSDTILQGETLAPILCSSHVDSIGKECIEENKYLYMYGDSVGVPALTLIDDSIAVAKCGLESIELNEYLNCKSNMKRLQYSESKCNKMHTGPKKEDCPDLEIDSWKIKTVKNIQTSSYDICDEVGEIVNLKSTDAQKYLGDFLSSSGKNMVNILKRKQKGYTIIDQIKKILYNGFFGKYHFSAAVLLKECLLINSILVNADVWTNLTKKEINQLTIVDNAMVRAIWECPSYTSIPIMFLELGIKPIKYYIIQRRIMYYHYLLNQDQDSLLYKCVSAQYKEPLCRDWIL